MIKGLILKGVGGKYTIKTKQGIFISELRGSIKYSNDRPIVGDFVEMEIIDEKNNNGMIKTILPRKTKLHRPLVSNVSQAIIVFSIKNPDPHLNLLDRLLVFVEHSGLKAIICFIELMKGETLLMLSNITSLLFISIIFECFPIISTINFLVVIYPNSSDESMCITKILSNSSCSISVIKPFCSNFLKSIQKLGGFTGFSNFESKIFTCA
ncbi:GTPase RsgA [Clostridiaceae bacterium HSG29]|nr:GTPase RsgA [Clostridiaceae bacterium HSG29]